mmetsp:Transcript_9769/g.32432  ORF Transcript_9769/g.32432 Transcript_9769/m.32432 type:complete len:927 (+) Transcript_9769:309-3089(+)
MRREEGAGSLRRKQPRLQAIRRSHRRLLAAHSGLAHLLADQDDDERPPRREHLRSGEARRLEDALEGRDIDDGGGEGNLENDANIQLHVGGHVLEERLGVGGGRHSGRNLSDHQRVVVERRGRRVDESLLRCVRALADVGDHAGGEEEEGEPAAGHLHHAHVAVRVDEHATVDNLLDERVAREARHQRRLLGLPRIRDGRPDVGADVDGKDLGDVERQRDAHQLHEVGDALRHLGAQGVRDRLLQVLRREPALLDAKHNRRELVVEQDDVGRILGHLGAADAHGDSNVGLLKGRRVVDAVTGHRDDVAVDLAVGPLAAPLLQGLHNQLLVDGGHAGEDARVHHHLRPEGLEPQRLLGAVVDERVARRHLVGQLLVRDDGERELVVALGDDRDLLGDRGAGVRVVARDHDDVDAGVVAVLDRLLDARLGRVLDAEEADEDHVGQEVGLGVVPRGLVPVVVGGEVGALLGDAEDAPGGLHQPLGAGGDGVEHLGRHRLHARLGARADVDVLAKLEHALWRALEREDLAAVRRRLGDKHVLVGRVEGDLVERVRAHHLLGARLSPRLDARLHKRDLGRRAGVVARPLDDRRVVAHGGAQHLRAEADVVLRVRLGEVGVGRHRARLGKVDHLAQRHVALSERAGLVGADHRDTAERLDGVELADEHVAVRHLLRGDHQRDGHGRDQPLGHLREERADRRRDDFAEVVARDGRGDERGHADDDGDDGDEVNKVLDLDLKSRLGPRRLDAARDLAEEGRVTDEEDDGRRVALDDSRAVEGEVARVRGRRALLGGARVARLGDGFAGEGGVVHLHAVGTPQDPHVGRDAVARLQEDDVTREEVIALDHQLHALALGPANDGDGGSGLHAREGIHHALCLQLSPPLKETGRDDDSGEDDRRDCVIAQPGVDEADLNDDSAPQQDVEDAGKDLPE